MLETEIKKLTESVTKLYNLLERVLNDPSVGAEHLTEEKSSTPEKETQSPAPDVERDSSEDTDTAPGDVDESSGPDKEDVRAALVSLTAATDREVAVALMEKIGGCKVLGDKFPADKYQELIDACQEVEARAE